MISIDSAMTLVGFGAGLMLAGIVAGTVLHNRWLDRRLAAKKPKVNNGP